MSTGTAPRRLGKYELQEQLGYEGRAEVWKALDTQSHRTVAIKLLHPDLQNDPDFISRFLAEAKSVASLHHPNIVRTYDFRVSRPPETGSTLAYIVMDYIEGQTLANYIRNTSHQGKFPSAEDIVHLFTSISQAVDYAHQHGITHRNLKPANILLDQRDTTHAPMGEPRITNFDTARSLGTPSDISSALYIAPEQAQGYPGNELSDIYSLGVILYEICTGAPPFQGDMPAAIMRQHISSMPPSPALINRNVPPALAMVILRSLAKDPAARFTSASSLTAALAEAFNLPVPENLDQPAASPEAGSEPTLYRPLRPDLTPSGSSLGSTPFSPSLPIVGEVSPVAPSALSTPQFAASAGQGQATPLTPSYSTAGLAFPNAAPTQQPGQSQGIPLLHTSPTPPPAQRKRRRGLFIALIVLLLLVLLGSGLGAFLLLSHGGPTAATPSPQIVGQAFFASSGQLNENTSNGIDDELQINLQHVSSPAAGKSYYAWLLRDNNQPDSTPVLLGKLPDVKRGITSLTYPQGNSQHTDLLEQYSRILITEEDSNPTPISYSPDTSIWRYYAEIPQKPNPNDTLHHSMLDHIRYLLASEPTIETMGLHGGLNIHFRRNTGKILEWAGSARDYWHDKNTDLMKGHFIRILDFLDGNINVQADVPPNTPLYADAPVALLSPDEPAMQDQSAPDYLHEISRQLDASAQAPGATSDIRKIVAQISTALNKVGNNWLYSVRQDVRELVKMTGTELLSQKSLAILDDMVTNAFYAYIGQIDPNTNQVQEGAVQINYDIQRLATFNISPYTTR